MRIGVDFGHGTGQDRGANGYLNEENIIREYGPLVIAGLQKLGHTVYNVTPTQPGLTLDQSLAYRVNYANSLKVDLFVSCHVNAFQTDVAQGCEVEYLSNAGKTYADKICTEIAKLGFVNRGSKPRPNLYVLKYTSAVAVLIEPFFCDTKSDCNKYNATTLANAIIRGITGQDVPVTIPVVTPVINSIATPRVYNNIALLQLTLNKLGSHLIVDGVYGPLTLSALPIIKYLDKRYPTLIKVIQQILVSKGYKLPKYGCDSDYGVETGGALTNLQKDNGIVTNGEVHQDTWEVLLR